MQSVCKLYAICIQNMIASDPEPTKWDQFLVAAKQQRGSSEK